MKLTTPIAIAVVLMWVLGALPAAADDHFGMNLTFHDHSKALIHTTGSSGARFGSAMATDAQWLIAGEPGGDGVYTETGDALIAYWVDLPWPDGGYYFSESLMELVPSWQQYVSDEFGAAVDISGNFAIVGAPNSNFYGTNSGAAFVFEYIGTDGFFGWTYHSTIFNEEAEYLFGAAVDIDGMHILVGAPGAYSGGGNVYNYEIQPGVNGSVIRFIGELPQTRHGTTPARFGASIDSDGSIAVIGAPGADIDGASGAEGAAVAYYRSSQGAYSLEAYLGPAPEQTFDNGKFGEAIAIDGSVVLVGSPAGNASYSGTVASFERAIGGGWTLQDVLGEAVLGDLFNYMFGSAIAIDGNTAVVGNPYASPYGLSSGAGVVYTRSPSSGIWTKDHEITGWGTGEGDAMGTAVALGPNTVALGAPDFDWSSNDDQGAIYYYWRPDAGGEWQLDLRGDRPCVVSTETMDASIAVTDYSSFGSAVAVDGNSAIIGNSFGGEVFTGTVKLFMRESASAPWEAQPAAAFPPPADLQYFALYGSAVAMEGSLAVVGENRHGWWSEGNNGRVHIYLNQGGTWSLAQTLLAPSEDERFGTSVDLTWLNGDAFIVIGAPEHGSGEGGHAYVYRWIAGQSAAVPVQTLTETAFAGGPSSFGESVAITGRGSDELTVAIGNSESQYSSTPTGCVDVWRGYIYPNYGWWFYHEDRLGGGWDNAEPPPTYFPFQASSVDLDGNLLIVGIPTARGPMSVDNFAGRACIYRRTLKGDGLYWWTKESEITAPVIQPYDYTGAAVGIDEATNTAVVGVPGANYIGTNNGMACVYRHDGSGWQYTRSLIASTYQGSDGLGMALCMDGSGVLVGAPGYLVAAGYYPHGRGEWFDLDDSVTYIDSDNGSLGSVASWSIPPESPATGLFSMLLADPYNVLFDLQTWTGSLRVTLDQITLLLSGRGTHTVTGSIDVSAPSLLKTASLTLASGTLIVGDSVTVGSDEDAGGLALDSAQLKVQNALVLSELSTLTLGLMPAASRGNDESIISTLTLAPTLSGSVRVELGDSIDPDGLVVGDRFSLISAGIAPRGDLFNVVVLPGLAKGLAFQLSYGSPSARVQGGCPTGEIEDCFGNCCPSEWLGDSYCDDGSYSHNGVPIYLNCDTLGCDGGDCTECWSTGGEWEMAIEVVSLVGLLDFGDPNSTTVDGDPTAVEVVDLTGDGAEEICVTLAGAPGSLVIFENDGAGGVLQQIVTATGDDPVDISSGDFDGDGNNDLAVANNLSQEVTIYYNDDNDPSNGFTEEDLGVGGPPTCLAGINADFDMYDDLAVGVSDTDGDGNGMYEIYLGSASLRTAGGGMSGGGSTPAGGDPAGLDPSMEEDQKDYMFSARQRNGKTAVIGGALASNGPVLTMVEYTTGVNPGGMTVTDLNGDGQGDICVTSTTNGTVAILLQDVGGGGIFQSAAYVPIGDQPTRITAVDFDNDGHEDLAAIVQETNPITGGIEPVVRVLQGNGSLSFTSLETAWGESVALVSDGDISGDGLSELVTIGGGPALRNRGGVPELTLRETSMTCPGDFDANGGVNVDDLLILLGEFGSCTKSCLADMNGDGDVDIDDMLSLIGVWGPC